MNKVIKVMTGFFKTLSESTQSREYKFLSQAQSHAQLEALQIIWDQQQKRSGWK